MTDESLKPVDVKGPNLEEAIRDGLTRLGLSRNEVIIEIIEEGGGGFFGMGAKEALVRLIPLRAPSPPAKQVAPALPSEEKPVREEKAVVTPKMAVKAFAQEKPKVVDEDVSFEEAADEENDPLQFDPNIDYKKEAEIAKATLLELLEQMGMQAEIKMRPVSSQKTENPGGPWVLNIQGRDLGILIGRRGETLNALQFVTRLIVSRELQQRSSFVVDVEGYKTRREDTLKSLAHRMAARAKSQGRTMTLEPMPPNERRIIHLTLRGDRSVRTESVGTGDRRKVTIIPSISQK